MTPGREVFRQFSGSSQVIFYILAAITVAVFAYGAWLRIRKYMRGRPAGRMNNFGARLLRACGRIYGGTAVGHRDKLAGWMHALILWGFSVLFAGTLIIMVDYDFLRLVKPEWQFWKGTFYLWYSVTLDLFGLGFLIGLAVMIVRRGSAPDQLNYDRVDREAGEYDRKAYLADDAIFLWSLLIIGVTGSIVEAVRIVADSPAFEVWSVVGWPLAGLFSSMGLSAGAANSLHAPVWWVHGIMALGFVAYIPYSKAVHMLVDFASLAFSEERAGRELPRPAEDPVPEYMGYKVLEDFTWKELLDLDACTKCGRCDISCPARASGSPLSPRDLILTLREEAGAAWGGESWLHERVPGRNEEEAGLAGGVIRSETLWSCTTCLACVEACPVGIEHVSLITNLRRNLVENGDMDGNLQDVLEKIGRYGNSFGKSARSRARWAKELPFQIKDARKEEVEYLWFVGDFASFDPGLQDLTRLAATIFHRMGLDFGILYEGENNAGNDVRRVGEEGLFEMLVEKNLKVLEKATFQKIVTTDPHSLNTLKNEYPQFGAEFTVMHYTEVLAEHMRSGALKLENPLNYTATYHDPCYLARYNGLTEPPREVIRGLGLRLVEMPRHGENSFCCGAGGGRIWMSDSGGPGRPAELRIKEALELDGVEMFIVTCPKDVTMFRDAVKSLGVEDRIVVKEVMELLEEAIGVAEPAGVAASDEISGGEESLDEEG